MLSSVKKTILNNSITGEKIAGGTIDQIDKLIADAIQIPGTTPSQPSSINGSTVNIGTTNPIGSLIAQFITADTGGAGVSSVKTKTGVLTCSEMSFFSATGFLNLLNSGTLKTHLDASTTNPSYFLNQVVIGATTAVSPSAKLDVTGIINASAFTGTYINVTGSITGNNVFFIDGLAVTQSLRSFYDRYVIRETKVDSYASTLPAVTNANIAFLAAINQNLGATNTPTFAGLSVGGAGIDVTAGNLDVKTGQSIIYGAHTIPESAAAFMKLMNQDVKNGSSPVFNTVNVGVAVNVDGSAMLKNDVDRLNVLTDVGAAAANQLTSAWTSHDIANFVITGGGTVTSGLYLYKVQGKVLHIYIHVIANIDSSDVFTIFLPQNRHSSITVGMGVGALDAAVSAANTINSTPLVARTNLDELEAHSNIVSVAAIINVNISVPIL